MISTSAATADRMVELDRMQGPQGPSLELGNEVVCEKLEPAHVQVPSFITTDTMMVLQEHLYFFNLLRPQ